MKALRLQPGYQAEQGTHHQTSLCCAGEGRRITLSKSHFELFIRRAKGPYQASQGNKLPISSQNGRTLQVGGELLWGSRGDSDYCVMGIFISSNCVGVNSGAFLPCSRN